MKRKNLEILQKDGKFLLFQAGESLSISLSQSAKETNYQLQDLCERLGLSERHLRRLFETGLGISPKEWLRQERMVAARSLLRDGLPIKEVAANLGFSSSKMLTRDFLVYHGVTASKFQRKENAHKLEPVLG